MPLELHSLKYSVDGTQTYSTSIIWSCVLNWGKDGLRLCEELLRDNAVGGGRKGGGWAFHEGEGDADEVVMVLGFLGCEEWRTCNGNSEGGNAYIDNVLLFSEVGRWAKALDCKSSLLFVDNVTGGTAVLCRGRENSIGNCLETLGNSLRQDDI